jgi:hypothetical protein
MRLRVLLTRRAKRVLNVRFASVSMAAAGPKCHAAERDPEYDDNDPDHGITGLQPVWG